MRLQVSKLLQKALFSEPAWTPLFAKFTVFSGEKSKASVAGQLQHLPSVGVSLGG